MTFGLASGFDLHGAAAFGEGKHLGQIALHSAMGCGSSAMAGGSCRSGAISGGVSAFASPLLPANRIGRLVGSSAIGAVASKLSGGKAENGALTAAFSYLFNVAAEAMKAERANKIATTPEERSANIRKIIIAERVDGKLYDTVRYEIGGVVAPAFDGQDPETIAYARMNAGEILSSVSDIAGPAGAVLAIAGCAPCAAGLGGVSAITGAYGSYLKGEFSPWLAGFGTSLLVGRLHPSPLGPLWGEMLGKTVENVAKGAQ